jgi:hypothetical protein
VKKFTINEFQWLEQVPNSPASLTTRLSNVLYNSINCKCRVETVNPVTGEYRIVLQGTYNPQEAETQ